MKIIKETESTKDYNGKTRINNYYYLVDDKNKFSMIIRQQEGEFVSPFWKIF